MNKIVFALLLFSFAAKAQNFVPSDTGSKIHFVIKNFGFNTGGNLSGMTGKIKFDAKKAAESSFDVAAKVLTINTDNDKRDTHLKSADFFDAEKFPEIRIVSTVIRAGSDLNHFHFKGKLTIKNVTKPLEFDFTAEKKPGGALFSGDFEIDRTDFGVGGSSATMSDKVKVSISVFATPYNVIS